MANLHDNDMEKHDKVITWSKGQLVVTGLIFVSTAIFTIYMYGSGSISSVYDAAALVTLISVSGAIFGSNLCWYSKKAAGENHYKLRMSLYSDCAKVRLQYNEEMMKLMKEYELSEEDIEKINESGDLDTMMDSALSSAVSELDEQQSDSDSKNEVENFSL